MTVADQEIPVEVTEDSDTRRVEVHRTLLALFVELFPELSHHACLLEDCAQRFDGNAGDQTVTVHPALYAEDG